MAGIVTYALGLVATQWTGVALGALALCVSILIGRWASHHGDALVVAVALLLFWMPFQTTFTRFNISPQELAVYAICIVCALFNQRGVWQWIKDLLTTTSAFIRLAALVFVAACLQSIVRIAHPELVATANSVRVVVLYPLLFALLIAYTMRTRNAMRTLLQAFVLGGAAFAIYALALPIWGVDVGNGAVEGRLGAESSFLSLYHPNNLSLYLVLALAFVPAIFTEAIRNYRASARKPLGMLVTTELLLLIGAELMLLATWMTYSRGALEGVSLGAMVALIALAIWGRRYLRWIALSILGIVAAAFGALLFFNGPAFLGRYASLFDPAALSADPNVVLRLKLNERALHVIEAHPISGIGLQQFSTTGTIPFSPHNTYLDLWVGTGLYGVLAFIIVLLLGLGAAFAGVRHLSKTRDSIQMVYTLGFVIAIIAFAVQGFVETFDTNPRIFPVIWMLAFCADSAFLSLKRPQKQNLEAASDGAVETVETAERQPEELRLGNNIAAFSGQEGAAHPDQPAIGVKSAASADGDEDWRENTSTIPIWKLQTTVLPAWQLHSEGVDPWQVETLQLRALGADIRELHPPRLRALPAPSVRAPARLAAPKEPAPEPEGEMASSDTSKRTALAGEEMLRRAPTSFLWNQLYAMWFFATSFMLSVVITRGLSGRDYGIYATLTTVISTITFICAIGLEDTATVFLPRILARNGSGAAGGLLRRLLLTRILIIGSAGIVLAIGLLFAAPYLAHLGIPPDVLDSSQGRPAFLRAALISLYLIGSSVSTLQNAFFSAMLKSRVVLLIGGVSQVISVIGVFILLKSGWGIDGIFAALATVTWLTALAYLGPLSALLFARGKITAVSGGEMRKLMLGSWLSNITNSALGKQMDIMIMTAFAIGFVEIGYYNLAYQLTNIIGVVLISGLGGVGLAAMSAALAAGGRTRLASMWRANMMLQTLLASPLQIVSFFFADQIVSVLYGPRYLGAVVLLRVYLGFTILGRLTGGGASQSALYVIGKQRSVVVMRWSGLVINLILDLTLIQVYGPLGAIVATGFTQVWVGLMEFLLLRGHLGLKYPVAFAARTISVSLFAALLLTWWAPHGLFGLIAEFTLYGILFALGLWVVRSSDSDDLKELMLANPRLKSLVGAISRFIPHRKPAAAAA